jgi:hypothetical protein
MDDERALTLRQVAERCQLSYSTVFTMRRSCLPDLLSSAKPMTMDLGYRCGSVEKCNAHPQR